MNLELLSNWAWLIIALVSALNFFAFIMVGIDKRRSSHDHQRVPELYFFIWAIFFSSIGVLLGMLVFHHKTKKLSFIIGISFLLLQQIGLVYLLNKNY